MFITKEVLAHLNVEIRSEDGYVLWVKKWKKLHQRMVNLIKLQKTSIRLTGQMSSPTYKGEMTAAEWRIHRKIMKVRSSAYQHDRVVFSSVAKAMYEARGENKGRLHNGLYPKLGHNQGEEPAGDPIEETPPMLVRTAELRHH